MPIWSDVTFAIDAFCSENCKQHVSNNKVGKL